MACQLVILQLFLKLMMDMFGFLVLKELLDLMDTNFKNREKNMVCPTCTLTIMILLIIQYTLLHPISFLFFKIMNLNCLQKAKVTKLLVCLGGLFLLLNKDSKNRIWIGTTTLYNDSEFNGSLTLFENGKFTLLDSSMFPLHNSTYMFETPYGDLIFLSDGKNT